MLNVIPPSAKQTKSVNGKGEMISRMKHIHNYEFYLQMFFSKIQKINEYYFQFQQARS